LRTWNMTFKAGADYLGDLTAFGFPEGPDGDKTIREAAPDAWRRLGSRFMAEWRASSGEGVPWALEAYGEPGGGDAD
jgi:hypothetical protein